MKAAIKAGIKDAVRRYIQPSICLPVREEENNVGEIKESEKKRRKEKNFDYWPE